MDFISTITTGETLAIFGRTFVVFFFVFLVLRFLGRRHLAHFTYTDLLFVNAIGSIVGAIMISGEEKADLLVAVVAIAFAGLMVKGINTLSAHSSNLASLFYGSARLIIKDGAIIQSGLSREDFTEEDLMRLLREQSVSAIGEVRRAFLESDGELSVVLHKNHKKS